MSKESRIFDIEEGLIEFGCHIVRTEKSLAKKKAGNHFTGQLIRGGKSPDLNFCEKRKKGKKSRTTELHNSKFLVRY